MSESTLIRQGSQELAINSSEQLSEYLKNNPDIALEYIQDWLSYLTSLTEIMPASEVVKNIQSNPRTAGQFKVIETLLDFYAIGTHRKLINDGLANITFRESLEKLRKDEKTLWGRVKLAYRALRYGSYGLSMTELLEKIDSAIATLELVNSEIQQGQLKVSDAKTQELEIRTNANEIVIQTSNERRLKLEEADQKALEVTNNARRMAKEEARLIVLEAENKRTALEVINGQLETARLAKLEGNPELALAVESKSEKAVENFWKEMNDSFQIYNYKNADLATNLKLLSLSIPMAESISSLLCQVQEADFKKEVGKLIHRIEIAQVPSSYYSSNSLENLVSNPEKVHFPYLPNIMVLCLNLVVKHPSLSRRILKEYIDFIENLGNIPQSSNWQPYTQPYKEFLLTLAKIVGLEVYQKENHVASEDIYIDKGTHFEKVDTHELPPSTSEPNVQIIRVGTIKQLVKFLESRGAPISDRVRGFIETTKEEITLRDG